MKYYKVICQRGHCGCGKSLDIVFYIKANDAVDAFYKARKMPAVKHTRIPPSIKEISYTDYMENRKVSAYRKCEGGF